MFLEFGKLSLAKDTEDSYFGKGIFTQRGDKVTGTFRTNSSDYRYLEGVMDGDSLKAFGL